MGKIILTIILRFFFILMTLNVIWNLFGVTFFELCAAPPHIVINPITAWCLVFIRVYIIFVCVVFIVNQLSNKEEMSFNNRYNYIYVAFVIFDMIAFIRLFYDLIRMLSDIYLATIMLFSLGIMIWHINECHLVLSYKKEHENS